jgi:hypothetical protein
VSQAHKGSRLINIGQVKSTDLNTTFLAHYDITENDVLSGIAPLSNVSTLLPYSGKYGGGIAIEESTANIVTLAKQDFSGWNQYSGCVVTVTQNQSVPEWGTITATRIQTSGGGNTLKYYTSIETSISGGAYTAQCLIKNIGGKPVKFRTQIGNTVTVNVGETTLGYCIGTGNGTSQYQFRFEASTITDNLDFIVYQPQVERKFFGTSFTPSTRASGILTYPADCINPSQGTISFWYYPRYSSSDITAQTDSPKLIQAGNYYSNSSITIWNTTAGLQLYVKGSTNSVWSYSATVLPNAFTKGSWRMVAVTWNGTAWKTYVDGILYNSGTATETLGAISGNLLYVGGEGGDGGGSGGKVCNGIIDELRIDNIERTDEEILSWYYSGAPFSPKGVYTVAY